MSQLEQKYIDIENIGTSLIPAKTSIIVSLLQKITSLLGLAKEEV